MESSESNSLKIILAIVIPLSILVIVAIIVVIVKICDKRYAGSKYLSSEDTLPIKSWCQHFLIISFSIYFVSLNLIFVILYKMTINNKT